MESECDRMESIKALGGVLIPTDAGDLWAIFDNEFGESIGVEGRVPVLTCRSSDVERLQLKKGSRLTVGTDTYRLRRPEPDGTGMSRIFLEQ